MVCSTLLPVILNPLGRDPRPSNTVAYTPAARQQPRNKHPDISCRYAAVHKLKQRKGVFCVVCDEEG
jgi:hypothetical protein